MKELTPGLELGARFVLVRRIGRGGSAEVWLAVDRERSEQVALKILDESVAGDAARIAQLSGEVARARALPPGFTVAVHGLEQADDRTFLVMEFLEGGDLGQMRGRSFESWSRAADDVAAALEALACARPRAPRPQVRERFPRRRGPRETRRFRPGRARRHRHDGRLALQRESAAVARRTRAALR